MTPSGIETATFRFVAQHHRGPLCCVGWDLLANKHAYKIDGQQITSLAEGVIMFDITLHEFNAIQS